jgi:hypothetical protein
MPLLFLFCLFVVSRPPLPGKLVNAIATREQFDLRYHGLREFLETVLQHPVLRSARSLPTFVAGSQSCAISIIIFLL